MICLPPRGDIGLVLNVISSGRIAMSMVDGAETGVGVGSSIESSKVGVGIVFLVLVVSFILSLS